MKTLSLAGLLALLLTVTTWSAPNDRIDPKGLKDSVAISLGSKGAISFKQLGDRLAEPKLTQTVPENTPGLEIYKFERNESLVLLTVVNHFPKTLRYRAAVRLKGRKGYKETSILPAYTGLMNCESWGDPVEEILLFDFKLTNEKP